MCVLLEWKVSIKSNWPVFCLCLRVTNWTVCVCICANELFILFCFAILFYFGYYYKCFMFFFCAIDSLFFALIVLGSVLFVTHSDFDYNFHILVLMLCYFALCCLLLFVFTLVCAKLHCYNLLLVSVILFQTKCIWIFYCE